MKTFLTLVFALFVLANPLFAQGDDEKSEKESGIIPVVVVKWSPLHLLNTFSTAHLDVEVKLAKNITFQAGGSPVIPTTSTNSTIGERRGYKLKSEARYYFTPRPGRNTLFYLALSFDYNRLMNEKWGTFGFDCVWDNCAYQQSTKFEERRITQVVGGRFGLHIYLTHWLLLDVNAGVGIRWLDFDRINGPEDYDFYGEEFHEWTFRSYEDMITPAILLGAKFGVKIK